MHIHIVCVYIYISYTKKSVKTSGETVIAIIITLVGNGWSVTMVFRARG